MQWKRQEVGENQFAALDWTNEPNDILAIPEFRESVVNQHLPRGASRVNSSSSSFFFLKLAQLHAGSSNCAGQ